MAIGKGELYPIVDVLDKASDPSRVFLPRINEILSNDRSTNAGKLLLSLSAFALLHVDYTKEEIVGLFEKSLHSMNPRLHDEIPTITKELWAQKSSSTILSEDPLRTVLNTANATLIMLATKIDFAPVSLDSDKATKILIWGFVSLLRQTGRS